MAAKTINYAKFIKPATAKAIAAATSDKPPSKPQGPANPFWSQAAGKSWDPAHLPGTATQTPGTTPNNTGTTTPPAAPPAAPFLTPQQQLDQINFDSGIDGQIQTLTDGIRDAGISTAQGLVDAQHAHDVNTASANETAAARGLFQSSIRAGDLNDIDATLVTRQNILNTGLQNLTISNNNSVGRLLTQRGNGDNSFVQMAIQNAQAQVPVLPPASSSTHTTPNPAPPPPAPTVPPPPPEQQDTTHPLLPPGAPHQPHITDPFAPPPTWQPNPHGGLINSGRGYNGVKPPSGTGA